MPFEKGVVEPSPCRRPRYAWAVEPWIEAMEASMFDTLYPFPVKAYLVNQFVHLRVSRTK